MKAVFLTLLCVAILGTIILLIKLGNTSSFALQYSEEVHYQLGIWALALLALWVGAGVSGLALRRRTKSSS